MDFSTAYKRLLRLFVNEIFFVSCLIIFGIALGVTIIYLFGTPDVSTVPQFPFKQTSILYDRTGEHELYRLYDEENRILITHNAIPDTIRLATIASEDIHFYSHQGIDPLAIIRALKANVESDTIEQGASTITQQLARNLFLTRERTLGRKIREAFLAIKIDHALDKDVILDLYLNAVPYGSNTYGIETAAETYFHKSASELTLDESALLAALPNAPTYLSPYGKHREALLARQQNILRKMLDLGYISDRDFKNAIASDIFKKISPAERPIAAPHFVFYVLDQLKETYDEEQLKTEGLRIRTTLDFDFQKSAESIVATGAEKNTVQGAANAGLVALDPKSGQVLAMVGSKNYFDTTIDGNVNITTSLRQPGSAFKPFAYAAAFESGFQPETPILDTPTNFGPDGSGHDYIPRNYDGRSHGLMTMRQALAMSLNIPAVQTLALAGVEHTITLATRLGITTLTDPKRYGLALVLGGAEVKPIDMAHAFSVFSQEGIRHDLQSITSIIDRNGKEILQAKTTEGTLVLDHNIAKKINSILSDNQARTPIFGAHSPLAFPPGIQVAGKTGTTQNFRDAWTVGYTPSIAVAVWAGNNDNRPMHAGADGIFVAAPIWRAFMDIALKRFPETGFASYEKDTKAQSLFTLSPDLIGGNTIYIDKKTGREISPEKARKLKNNRVEKRSVNDTLSSDAPVAASPSSITSLQEIEARYQPTR